MHVGFVVPFLYRLTRGIERSCINLALHLAKLGQEITLLAWEEREVSTLLPENHPFRIFTVPYFRFYRNLWAVPFYLKEFLATQYDVVNVYFAGYGEAEALVLARRLRNFSINFIAGYPIEQVPHRYQEFRRWRFDQILRQIIVKSPSMVGGPEEFFGRTPTVIPNGIDLEYFSPSAFDSRRSVKQALGINPSARVILTVAALEERKGIQHVIGLLPKLRAQLGDVRYVVVGEGDYRDRLQKQIDRRGMSEFITLLGTKSTILPYYQIADAFVLLALGEGFPNVLLEAWAMGIPVVVSTAPPFPQIVPDELGHKVTPTEPEQVLAAVRLALMEGPETERQALRRNHVEENYAWPVVAREYLDVFAAGVGPPV